MSATIPNSNSTRPTTDVIWSRGGGSFRRLVWKELSEVAGVCGTFALVILIAALWARFEWVTSKGMFSLPIIFIQITMVVFPLIVGARAFAREIENGTWELLRSAGASAWEVWLSKMLVASLSSLGIYELCGVAISMSHSREVTVSQLCVGVVFAASSFLPVLCVSMHCSLWLRKGWLAMIVSTTFVLSGELIAIWRQLHWPGLATSPLFGFLCWCAPIVFVVLLWTTQLRKLRRELLDHSAIDDSRRWWKVFWRMVWKDLLAARDFWLAVLGIVLLLDGVAWWVFREVQTRDSTLVVIGFMLPLLHSLGCGAITFALEREDGTHDWLRRISAPAGAVFAAKLLVSQASIISLTSLVLFPTQWLVSADARLSGDACVCVLLAVTLNGMVGLGASMLTRRVLPAMFLAFVGAVAMNLIVFGSGNKAIPLMESPVVALLMAALSKWLLVGAALLAVECWLSDWWLNERPWWKKVWRGDARKIVLPRRSVAWFEHSPSPEKKAFGRLLWREWLEARCWLWALPIGFAPWLMYEMAQPQPHRGFSYGATWHLAQTLLSILSITLTILPTLWGVWAFHHDQRQGLFRFLSDRGGSPTGIWLSKHAVWLPQVLFLALIAGSSLGLFASSSLGVDLPWQRQSVGFFVGIALVGALQGYAAGQWLAQLIRSPLTSIFLASVLSLLLGFWARLLWRTGAPWPYQLAPAAILLFASLVHMRDWLEERWTWRAWLKIVSTILLPAAELVIALEARGYPVWKALRDWTVLR